MLYVSGQIALDPATNELVVGGIREETERIMLNLGEILKASGYNAADIVKTSIFLSDMAHFAVVNEVYGAFFDADYPARETVAVAGLPKNVNVEISVIAYRQ